jgi:hypothetical protein
MFPHAIDALDDHAILVGKYPKNLALVVLIFPGEDYHHVAAFNVSCHVRGLAVTSKVSSSTIIDE